MGLAADGTTYTEIVVERDGQSRRATAQDTHTGATEYTFTSATAVNGVSAGSVRASSPQPATLPAAPGSSVIDVGMAIDIDALAAAFQAGAVTYQMACDAVLFSPGSPQAWLGDPEGLDDPRPTPPSLPNNIWKIVPKADRIATPDPSQRPVRCAGADPARP